MPNTTKNRKIPAVPETAEIKPSVVTESIVCIGLKPVASKPPAKIPIKSDE